MASLSYFIFSLGVISSFRMAFSYFIFSLGVISLFCLFAWLFFVFSSFVLASFRLFASLFFVISSFHLMSFCYPGVFSRGIVSLFRLLGIFIFCLTQISYQPFIRKHSYLEILYYSWQHSNLQLQTLGSMPQGGIRGQF